jgi:hypothetical protein
MLQYCEFGGNFKLILKHNFVILIRKPFRIFANMADTRFNFKPILFLL